MSYRVVIGKIELNQIKFDTESNQIVFFSGELPITSMFWEVNFVTRHYWRKNETQTGSRSDILSDFISSAKYADVKDWSEGIVPVCHEPATTADYWRTMLVGD